MAGTFLYIYIYTVSTCGDANSKYTMLMNGASVEISQQMMMTRSLLWWDVAVCTVPLMHELLWLTVVWSWLANRAVWLKRSSSSIERKLLWSHWQQKHGWTYQKAEFVDKHSSPQYNRYSCYLHKSHSLSATTKLRGFIHDYNASFQSLSLLHFKHPSTVVRDVIN